MGNKKGSMAQAGGGGGVGVWLFFIVPLPCPALSECKSTSMCYCARIRTNNGERHSIIFHHTAFTMARPTESSAGTGGEWRWGASVGLCWPAVCVNTGCHIQPPCSLSQPPPPFSSALPPPAILVLNSSALSASETDPSVVPPAAS